MEVLSFRGIDVAATNDEVRLPVEQGQGTHFAFLLEVTALQCFGAALQSHETIDACARQDTMRHIGADRAFA